MSSNLLGELAANNGTFYLTAEVYVGRIDQIIVRGEGVVIDAIYVIRNGESIEVQDDYISNKYVANGLRITPKNDEVFTRVVIETAPQGTGLELVLSA
jgi:hypothetical protein